MKAVLTDSLGYTTTFNSAAIGGVWRLTDAQGSGCSSCSERGTVTNTYDTRGNLTDMVDEGGRTTHFTYDATNKPLTETRYLNGSPVTTSYTYNSFGEALTVTDPLGNVTTNAYDANGNLTSITMPAPATGVAASVTTFGYETKGELTTITDPLSHITTMAYTAAGLVGSITDANLHTTAFSYDQFRRVTQTSFPSSYAESYLYDAVGNMTSKTDRKGQNIHYVYDALNRLTQKQYPDASHVDYVYDLVRKLQQVSDTTGSYGFAYGDNKNVTNEEGAPYGAPSANFCYVHSSISERSRMILLRIVPIFGALPVLGYLAGGTDEPSGHTNEEEGFDHFAMLDLGHIRSIGFEDGD